MPADAERQETGPSQYGHVPSQMMRPAYLFGMQQPTKLARADVIMSTVTADNSHWRQLDRLLEGMGGKT